MNCKGTLSYFRSLIILESFFCINRYYLLDRRTTKILSIFICIFCIICLTGSVGYEMVYLKLENQIAPNYVYIFIGVELVLLMNDTRKRLTFETINRLDEKCDLRQEYVAETTKSIKFATAQNLASSAINIGAICIYTKEFSAALLFGIGSSAHDAEVDFISLIIEAFNLRLTKLKDDNPSAGSRVYRHILITAAQFGEEFNSKIIYIFGVAQIKTVLYTVLAFMNEDKMLVCFLLWRQVRTAFGLWCLCLTASNTNSICNNLVFHFAKRLTLDPRSQKDNHRQNYDVTRRLHKSVSRERPRYLSGAIQSIDLNIPLNILDASINYILIMLQVYVAFK